jgi:hypothetical protein
VRRRRGAALSGKRGVGFSNRKHIGDENLFSSVRRVAKPWPYAGLAEGRGPPFEFYGKRRSQERSGFFRVGFAAARLRRGVAKGQPGLKRKWIFQEVVGVPSSFENDPDFSA